MKLACLRGAAWFGVPLILLSGCATSDLWEEGTFANYHEPASPPNLQLFQSDRRKALLVR